MSNPRAEIPCLEIRSYAFLKVQRPEILPRRCKRFELSQTAEIDALTPREQGFPHGMPATQADTINADRLAFVRAQ